jgi:type II secretory ATPase GspE/PulE/Tfp pilus assembly ATPase PilB-like protein
MIDQEEAPQPMFGLDETRSAADNPTLGAMLIAQGDLSPRQLETALRSQAGSGQLLGHILVDHGMITAGLLADCLRAQYRGEQTAPAILARMGLAPHHVAMALSRQRSFNEPLHDIMQDWSLLSPEKVAKVVAIENHLEYFPRSRIDEVAVDGALAGAVELPEYRGYVPIGIIEGPHRRRLSLVIADIRRLAEATITYRHFDCHVQIGSRETCQTLHRRLFARTAPAVDALIAEHASTRGPATGTETARTALCQHLLMAILRHACFSGASDISLHRSHHIGMVRLKVDGSWRLFRSISGELLEQLFGVMRNTLLDGVLDERLRQGFTDCSLDLNTGQTAHTRQLRERHADIAERYVFRVELGNSVQGRTTTIRINDRQASAADLDQLGFDADTRERLRGYMQSRSGVFLVCGPTGSGKTTTLYALLQSIDPVTTSIQTIESPVEYTHGLWQQFPIDLHSEANEGREWGLALKGILRNAPDTILFGEVRDEGTARELFRAANTGHLVLSTLHANGAIAALARLDDLGIGRDRAATGLLGILAQRLVRKLCSRCKLHDDRPSTWHLLGVRSLGEATVATISPCRPATSGCANCNHTGYRGRRMIHELLHCSDKVRDQMETLAPLSSLRSGIRGRTMRDCGLALVSEGVTSIDELATHLDLDP